MSNLCTEAAYCSLNKSGEQLCGDHVEIVRKDDDSFILVLADGLGSGVKACILSTLTAKIISTMIAQQMSVEECVATIASTLPVCEKRGIAYSTFTIIQIINNREAEIIQFDNPHVIFLRNGKNCDYEKHTVKIGDKLIFHSKLQMELGDHFIAISDGAVYAGVGRTLNYGWQRENIIAFMEDVVKSECNAKMMASLLADECLTLYNGQPGDDTTVAVVQIRNRQPLNIMIGPPSDPADVNKMMSAFFSLQGKHIVCGGTTSKLCAKYLQKELITQITYLDPEIPPTAEIEGVDLVTEGIVTMNRVLKHAKACLQDDHYDDWSSKKDGASLISQLIFEETTDVFFFVGKAINPAHQNPDLPGNLNLKVRVVEELSECLRKMGKKVHIRYF